MTTAGIRVLFIGKRWDIPYEVDICGRASGLFLKIAEFRPDVIITSEFVPGNLKTADFETRKRWEHINPNSSPDDVIRIIENNYFCNIWKEHPNQKTQPLISVYTGSYNTGDVLLETYNSLKDQTYTNWEWVVVDDESTDGTWQRLNEIAGWDHRVRPFRMKHNGKIGAVKDAATRLSYGRYLIELDHDDMLVDTALAEVRIAFESEPDVGMVYTNCACFFPDGSPQEYNDDFWKVRYRDFEYRGKVYREAIQPDMWDRFSGNPFHQFFTFLTVGPNHIRAYRSDFLRELGGYNLNLPIADDLDVFLRFALASVPPEVSGPGRKIKHINKCLYLYRFGDNWSNTTFTRNKSIQDHVALVRNNYRDEIIEFNNRRLSNQKKLSVVIADWNTQDLTLRCVDSIRKYSPAAEIIVVQNGEKFESVNIDTIIPMEMNIGFAAAMNRGVMEAKGEFVCLLNSDTVVNEGLLDRLIEEASKPGVGVVAPYSNNARPPQGNISEEAAKTLPNVHLPSVVGLCMVMRRDLFNVVGGMDSSFCNFEDDDLCQRLRNAGYKSLVIGGTWIHHEDHASFKKNKVDLTARMEESRALYKKKWPKVAVVAITLNEVNTLPGYFEQYFGKADYFGILDSGSTDGTVDWAKAHNVDVRVRKFDQFDNQRNAAIEMVPPDTEWIVMHDPDERMDKNTLDNLWELTRDDRYDMYYSPLRSENWDGSHTEWVAKPFLFRNNPEIRWVFPVHEKLIGSYKQAIITNAMNTHYLKLHDPARRKSMEDLYASLGQDGGELGDWPILNYHKRSDPRIIPVVLGPRVSVIIPTYRRKDLLLKAVESAKNQDYLAKDIIVIGDNDPDFVNIDTCRCVNLPTNHGAGGAVPRNYGITLASTDWIAYLDDDNEWRPDHLSSLMQPIIDGGLGFAVASLEVEGKILVCDKVERGKADTSALVHHKELVRRFGFWRDRQEKGYCHDWEFIRPWVEAGVRHACTCNPTVVYNRKTSGQSEYLAKLLGLAG